MTLDMMEHDHTWGAMNSQEIEDRLRYELWTQHGHQGLYGDDGEMQCGQCHIWDYRRSPLKGLIYQVDELRMIEIAKQMKENKNG